MNYIKRQDLKSNPNTQYLFGDNLKRSGFGGQAKEMRGEPNAIGIPTKKKPSNTSDSFFNDLEFEQNKKAIDRAFEKIDQNRPIIIPEGGIGTGLANLKNKAPKTYKYLQNKLQDLIK